MLNDKDNYKKKLRKMMKTNAFYFALGLCLLGAGVAGISATNSKKIATQTENTTSIFDGIVIPEVTTEKKSTSDAVEINIDEFINNNADEPSTASVFDNNSPAVSEEPTEAEAVIFYSPLGFSIGKDYSMGIPVFSQTMNDYRTHNGVDFRGVKGENVKTPATGTVVSVTKDAVWGNTVTIDHKNGITSSISGLADEALISVGTEVYTDTIIGVVGDIPIESADEAHIHLEMRTNGQLVDPIEILGLAGE